MFCTQCGAQIPDDSRFCEQCGAAVSAEGQQQVQPAQFSDWNIETDHGVVEDFTVEQLLPLLGLVAAGEWAYLTLTPPELIEGSRYMQVCSDDGGALHIELCMARSTAGFEIYGIDGISQPDAGEMLGLYLEQVLPRPPEGHEWRLI